MWESEEVGRLLKVGMARAVKSEPPRGQQLCIPGRPPPSSGLGCSYLPRAGAGLVCSVAWWPCQLARSATCFCPVLREAWPRAEEQKSFSGHRPWIVWWMLCTLSREKNTPRSTALLSNFRDLKDSGGKRKQLLIASTLPKPILSLSFSYPSPAHSASPLLLPSLLPEPYIWTLPPWLLLTSLALRAEEVFGCRSTFSLARAKKLPAMVFGGREETSAEVVMGPSGSQSAGPKSAAAVTLGTWKCRTLGPSNIRWIWNSGGEAHPLGDADSG